MFQSSAAGSGSARASATGMRASATGSVANSDAGSGILRRGGRQGLLAQAAKRAGAQVASSQNGT